MATRGTTAKTTTKPLAPATVGFRLDAESRRVLMGRAKQLKVSPHELARHYVILMLHEAEERAMLREDTLELRRALIQLREDVATTAEALLVAAGEVSEEQAHAWVEEHFKESCSRSPSQ